MHTSVELSPPPTELSNWFGIANMKVKTLRCLLKPILVTGSNFWCLIPFLILIVLFTIISTIIMSVTFININVEVSTNSLCDKAV